MEVKNSSGYFKDPKTFEDFTPDTPRIIPCKLENGKFQWPMVATSDANLVKIVYKLFTDEEKLLYKQYRGYDTSKPLRKRGNGNTANVQRSSVIQSSEPYDVEDMSYHAIAQGTADLVDKCERLIGTQFCSGITYALLKVKNSNVVYWVPYALIEEHDKLRLCNG